MRSKCQKEVRVRSAPQRSRPAGQVAPNKLPMLIKQTTGLRHETGTNAEVHHSISSGKLPNRRSSTTRSSALACKTRASQGFSSLHSGKKPLSWHLRDVRRDIRPYRVLTDRVCTAISVNQQKHPILRRPFSPKCDPHCRK